MTDIPPLLAMLTVVFGFLGAMSISIYCPRELGKWRNAVNNRILLGCLCLVMCLSSPGEAQPTGEAQPNRVAEIDRRLNEANTLLVVESLNRAKSSTESAVKLIRDALGLTRDLDVGEEERTDRLIAVSNMFVRLGEKQLALDILRSATKDIAETNPENQSNLITIFKNNFPSSAERCEAQSRAFDPCCWNCEICPNTCE